MRHDKKLDYDAVNVEDQRAQRQPGTILGDTIANQLGRRVRSKGHDKGAEWDNDVYLRRSEEADEARDRGGPNIQHIHSRFHGPDHIIDWPVAPREDTDMNYALGGPVSPFGSYTPIGGSNAQPAQQPFQPMDSQSTNFNPQAQQMQSMGRGQDSMLVHMTPDEVSSLRGLAQQFGGDLSTNPHTGFPEAGFLSGILPTLFGGLLSLIPGIGPLAAAGIVGLGTTAVTGDLSKGLLAGLGAFGGAGLGGALAGGAAGAAGAGASSLGGALAGGATDAASALASGATGVGGAMAGGANAALNASIPQLAAHSLGGMAAQGAAGLAPNLMAAASPLAQSIGSAATPNVLGQAGTITAGEGAKPMNFFQKFQDATHIGGVPKSLTTGLAGYGLLGGLAQQPNNKPPEEENKYPYKGPYTQAPRTPSFPVNPAVTRDSSEHQYFDNVNPQPGVLPAGANAGASGSYTNPLANLSNEDIQKLMHTYGGQMGFASGGHVSPGDKGAMHQPHSPQGISGNNTPQGMTLPPGMVQRPPIMMMPPQDGMPQGMQSLQGQMPQRFQDMMRQRGGMPPGGLGAIFSQMQGGPRMPATPPAQPGFAKGGPVPLREGSFVVDARTVSELGNGSSSAGQEVLARHGGRPVHGHGDGVSDSIPASIDNRHSARVARDEVHFSPQAVARLGGGDPKRGTQKLYDLMNRAAKARRTAKRGQDTKLSKGMM